jgi:ParB-like chromosome segregation protein Spo0J
MITTKRYDYVPFEGIQVHPALENHRSLTQAKVEHYAEDIQKNGLLEPLIVWERNHYEFFLVGGFHRRAAIQKIREKNADYFDRIDVRVVTGSLEEMRALNLKLNADRLDAKLTDYFDSVVFLNNANWSKEQIAEFLDKSVTLIDEMLRFVPSMPAEIRRRLEAGSLSWNKAKQICRAVLSAAPGQEQAVLKQALAELDGAGAKTPVRRPITMRKAVKRLADNVEAGGQDKYQVTSKDLLALLMVLKGKGFEDEHVERVRSVFPGLLA